ncbi:MAG: Stk1 family PASTA domain-containing Ser/Thr kinase [Actinomycetaceae bacterium]|nr:Stk1 family PASTA domain-containing Ser/Thr kinase [Actinomycetaceae bacterium]
MAEESTMYADQTPPADPLLGAIVDERYLILDKIASGGMATVYKAHDERLDRLVAVKVMHRHLAESADLVARFRREARATARLSHPGVVAVFDQGIVDGCGYLVMEYIPGKNLRQLLIEQGSFSLRRSLEIVRDTLRALASAHRAGLIHRDVKPENILLIEDNKVKVADFGLARAISDATLASTGSVLGTVAYIAPELVTQGEADARSDIYSVGILLYELIAGTPPYDGKSQISIAWSHVHENIPRLSESLGWIPAEVDNLICTLAARSPWERPQNGNEASEAISAVLESLPAEVLDRRADVKPQVPPPPTQTSTMSLANTKPINYGRATSALPVGAIDEPTPPKKPRWVLALAIVLLIVAIASGVAWWFIAGPGMRVRVPVVTGIEEIKAVQVVQKAELQAKTKYEFSDKVRRGQVIASKPDQGTRVKPHTVVTLVVSKGVRMVRVPSVLDKDKDQAIADLKTHQLTVGDIKEEYSITVPKGKVIASDPGAGAVLKHGTAVKLTVSKGREPVKVPGLVGKTAEEATKLISQVGLQATVTESYSDSVPEGKVISQSMAEGAQALRGDQITYILSRGPEIAIVPNLRGTSMTDAKSTLENMGFKVNIESRLLGIDPSRVYDQSPHPGTKLKRGEVVTLIHI